MSNASIWNIFHLFHLASKGSEAMPENVYCSKCGGRASSGRGCEASAVVRNRDLRARRAPGRVVSAGELRRLLATIAGGNPSMTMPTPNSPSWTRTNANFPEKLRQSPVRRCKTRCTNNQKPPRPMPHDRRRFTLRRNP